MGILVEKICNILFVVYLMKLEYNWCICSIDGGIVYFYIVLD